MTPSGGCALQILGEPKENRKLAAEITMQNPLPEPLEECCFSIEGANLTGGHVISERLDESLEAVILSLRTKHQLSRHELETTETFLVNHLKKKKKISK